MIEQIRNLRVKIDGLARLTKELTPVKVAIIGGYKNSKEIEKAADSLYLAKAWLGKVLGELGEETPYKNDGNRKTVADIEPTADTAQMNLQSANYTFPDADHINWMDGKNHIERVDWLRQEIKTIIEKIPNYSKWIEEQIDNFYKNVEYDNKEDAFNKEQKFMSSLPNLQFEFDLVYKYLSEARFWLGFELQRIKENEKSIS